MSDTKLELLQAKELLERENSIAMVPAYDFCGDTFAASLALFSTLKKMGKKAMLSTKDWPPQFAFLKELGGHINETVLVVDAGEKEFKRLRYEKNGQELKIYLTLQGGQLQPSDISLNAPYGEQFQVDQNEPPELIAAVGFSDFEKLESAFASFPKLLYEIPILNIDNQITNGGFGHLNLIDPAKPSISEITAELIEIIDKKLLDPTISTYLLAGIISATQNFQHPRSSPDTLSLAGKLMEHGADHRLIIKHLYKTKSLTQMHLLGRALEKLHFVPEKEASVTTLSEADFQETQTTSKDLAFVLGEIKANFPQLSSLLLLWENHGSDLTVGGILTSKNSLLINKIRSRFEGTARNNTVLFIIRERKLDKAEEDILRIL